MGAGRKTQTFTAPPNQDLATYTTSMRNLVKNRLGGVIFGCKNNTIKECLSEQIFGLPSGHLSYVKNVSPGLPLFLFNYTDRKLHGIFEATSHGQKNINPYGWTDGSEETQFPAQVRIRLRLQCKPLLENQFKEIIADNYYTECHFWFELDHSQTSKLISKLESVAVAPSVPQRSVAVAPSMPQRSKLASVAVSPSVPQRSKLASVAVTPSTSVPQKPMAWRKLFTALPSHEKTEESHGIIEEPEWLEPLTTGADHLSNSNQNLDSTVVFGRYNTFNSQVDVKEAEKMDEERIYMKLEELALQCNITNECQGMSLSGDVKQKSRESPWSFSPKSGESSQNLFEHQAIIAKLIQEVDELKAVQREQSKKIGYLEDKLVEAEKEINGLKAWY